MKIPNVKILQEKDSIIKICKDETKAFRISPHFKNENDYGGTPHKLIQDLYLYVGYVHSSLNLPNSEKGYPLEFFMVLDGFLFLSFGWWWSLFWFGVFSSLYFLLSVLSMHLRKAG